MPFATEQTFRSYLGKLLSQPSERGTSFAYRPLAKAFNNEFGIKWVPLNNIEQLLASVNSITIVEDPLAGLPVGQQVAYVGDTPLLRVHHHIPNEGNLRSLSHQYPLFPIFFESHDAREGKHLLHNIQRISHLPDKKLKEWLEVVVELDRRSFAIDTMGHNILMGKKNKSIYFIDVDDPYVVGKSEFPPSDFNHLAAIMQKLRCNCDIEEHTDPSHPRENSTQELYAALIQEEYYGLYDRMKQISEEVGLPLNKSEYLKKSMDPEKIPRPLTPIILEEIPVDSPIDFVASRLRHFHRPNTEKQIPR